MRGPRTIGRAPLIEVAEGWERDGRVKEKFYRRMEDPRLQSYERV